MVTVMLNLLSDAAIHVDDGDAVHRRSLPDLLADLTADRIRDFPRLRPHQRHAWHAFLAQLGAVALHAADEATPPDTADDWRALLRGLTPGHPDDAPWTLVVDDPTRPAFLQPPSPPGAPAPKTRIATPDALDVLVTSRNFDVKRAVALDATPEDWVFALISLQTMEGFLGAGNYGVARMNGGFSARPFLGLAPSDGGIGAHLRRDWRAMLAARAAIADANGYPEDGGKALLWLEPWDGRSSLRMDRLDPFFIEVCRRVRLGVEDGRLIALGVGTEKARIDAKARNGVTGDFWAPVGADEKAFSLTEAGFSARTLCRLLFDSEGKRAFHAPPALTALPEERRTGGRLVARGLARGQGNTEGWHERIIPLSSRFAGALTEPDARERLGRIAEAQLAEIRHVARALSVACATIACAGADEGPKKDHYPAARPYADRLQAEADALFFAALQDRFEESAEARRAFLRALACAALALKDEAAATIPCPTLRRPRARVRADQAFFRALWAGKGPLANDRDLLKGAPDAA
jgi:CRISPR system Cascade subunit CasA